MLIGGIILGIIILVLLVVVHELGHAIVARRNGVKVEEFGVGFPPKAWSKKPKHSFLGKDVEFSLNWLPIGGFVRLKGEHDAARNKGDYGAASFWVKTKILLAGVVINWLVAAVLLTGLALTGLPKIVEGQFSIPDDTKTITKPVQIVSVQPDSPAQKAGLAVGDQITRIDDQPIDKSAQLPEITGRLRGETVQISYSRDGAEKQTKATLRNGNEADTRGALGIAQGQQELIQATWSAPIVGIVNTAQFSWLTVQGVGQALGNLFSGLVMQFSPDQQARENGGSNLAAARDSVAGPISVVGMIFPAAQKAGLTQLVFLTAIISLTLAVMNVLPIPALDGGRWYTMALFRLFRQKLTKEREERVQMIGFLIILMLIITVTITDIGKVF